MNKQNVVSGWRLLFKRVLPKWLVALALGLQIAVVAMLLVLSIFFTVTFKRVGSQLGKITEQVDYHSGIPSAVLCYSRSGFQNCRVDGFLSRFWHMR